MTRLDLEEAVASEAAQAANRAATAESEHIGVLALERAPQAYAAEENAGVADSTSLYEQLFNQRGRFAGALPPKR